MMKLVKFLLLWGFYLTCLQVGQAYGMDKKKPTADDLAFDNIKAICNRIATNGVITDQIMTLFLQKRDGGTLPRKTLSEYYDHCIKQLEPVLSNETHRHYQFAVVCTHALLNNMGAEPEYSCKLLCYSITQKNIGLFLAIVSRLGFKNLSMLRNEATILHLCAQHNFTAGARLMFKNNKRSVLILCVDQDGKTPLDWATDYNGNECRKFLEHVVSNKTTNRVPGPQIPSTTIPPVAILATATAPGTPPQVVAAPGSTGHVANNPALSSDDKPSTTNVYYLGKSPLLYIAGLSLCVATLYGVWKYLKTEEKYDDEDNYDA
jgi:hypothetical protein